MKILTYLLISNFFVLTSNAQDELVRFLPPNPPSLPPQIVFPQNLREPDIGPMQTREMSITVHIKGLQAEVATTIHFHNPNARELEGELIFPLPDGAAVSAYALDIQGQLIDGVIVPKEKARIAFETETRRNVDPGLVEHVQGNLYRTRIFPLPAKGERRIRLTYTTPLLNAPNGDAALLIPMPRESISKLNVEISALTSPDVRPIVGGLGDKRFEQANQIWQVKSSSENTTPGENIIVALPKLPASIQNIERDPQGKTWFLLSDIAPKRKLEATDVVGNIHILWDATGSRATNDLTKEYELLSKIKATTYHLTVFRDITEPTREFKSINELITAIKAEPFDGGSDFTALTSALKQNKAEIPNTHTLLFTDGFDTLSGQAIDLGGIPTTAIVSQTISDRESLRQACGGSLIDLQTTEPAAAWFEIANPSPRVSGLQGTGIAQVQGIGQPATGRIKLLGQLTQDEAIVKVIYADGSTSEAFTLRSKEATAGKVISTAWASARINQLSPRASEFESELLTLGRTYGLVSPSTSLIVLETLDQWLSHEIEPPASLAKMRTEWQAAMKSKSQNDQPTDDQRLEQIVSLWQARVDWWKTDFSKGKPKTKFAKKVAEFFGAGNADPFLSEASVDALQRRAAPAPNGEDQDVDAFAPAQETPSNTPRILELAASASLESTAEDAEVEPNSLITIKPWDPETPYLKTLRAASPDQRYTAYLSERTKWLESPAFFLDCADFFYKNSDRKHGRRILSNLSEIRVEDAALLRVLAWRLREANELPMATVILRRITKLRPEEPQSIRDLALVLADQGRTNKSAAHLEEAMRLLLDCALGKWNRHGDTITIFALEELNALIAWIEKQDWREITKPTIPDYDKRLRQNLDTDIRIIMSWDADATDIDLHVLEPNGEEAFYQNNRTGQGGLVSQDITDGYGPEEYLMRIAPGGSYTISTKYFASHQQQVVGNATVSATVFTNWGRPNEKRQTLTIRLDEPKDIINLGAIKFGRSDLASEITNLKPGMTRDQVIKILGQPNDPNTHPITYTHNSKTYLLHFDDKNQLTRISETLPGGTETIIIQ